MRRQEVFGLTTPLVLKADGTKFGKTESGTVWLDAAPDEPLRSCTSSSCAPTTPWWASHLRYFTFLDHDAIRALDAVTAAHPERREAQRALAREVCTLVHGPAESTRAEAASMALYSGTLASLDEHMLLEMCKEMPSSTWTRSWLDSTGLALVDALVEAGLATSKRQARTLVTQGGVSVNDQRVKDADARQGRSDLLFDRFLVLRKGRDYHLVCFE